MNPAKWLQTATSTTELTHSIRLAHFILFALASSKMRLASLGAEERVDSYHEQQVRLGELHVRQAKVDIPKRVAARADHALEQELEQRLH